LTHADAGKSWMSQNRRGYPSKKGPREKEGKKARGYFGRSRERSREGTLLLRNTARENERTKPISGRRDLQREEGLRGRRRQTKTSGCAAGNTSQS